MKLIFLPLAFLAASLAATAADGPDPTVKLREQLRSTLLQLRTAQTETANLQAAQAAAEAKTKDLETKLAAAEARNAKLAKELNDDKAAAERSIATLNNKLAEREKRIVKYDEALAEWKAGYQKAAEVARTKEDERAALAAEVVVFKRTSPIAKPRTSRCSTPPTKFSTVLRTMRSAKPSAPASRLSAPRASRWRT
jgi:septal ring factor EnvC (AmiA/AmiB activator)